MAEDKSLEHVQSHGVCSVRHVNGICVIPKDNSRYYEILSPLGPTLQRWEIRLPNQSEATAPFTRLGPGIPLHRDAITCLVMIQPSASNGTHLVMSTSYSGQIRLWRIPVDYTIENSVQVPKLVWEAQENDASLPVMHVSVLGSHLAVSSFRRDRNNLVPLSEKQQHGSISLWNMELNNDGSTFSVTKKASVASKAEMLPLWIGSGDDRASHLLCAVNQLDVRFTKTPSNIALFNESGFESVLELDVSAVTCFKSFPDSQLICCVQMNRTCKILRWHAHESRLEVLSSTKLSGSGAIFSVALTPALAGFEMFVCEDTGEVSCWLVSGSGHHVSKQHSIRFSSASCSAYNVEPLSPSLLLTCSAAGLSLSKYERDASAETFSLMWHDISCCGVASTGPTGTEFYAVGDLSGRVLLWSSKIAHDGAPCLVLQHEAGVRCVSSFPLPSTNRCILVAGLMDGSVHQYTLEGSERPTVVQQSLIRDAEFDTTVTSIAFHPRLPVAVVADSHGKAQIFREVDGKFRATETVFQNAQRDHVTSREIWSVAFHDGGKLLALANEDFSVKILQFGEEGEPLQLLHTLTGPTAATTAVRWLGNCVYASSDDCTIHVWQVSEANTELRRVLRTDPSHLVRFPPYADPSILST
eukprot:TRINITY_DN2352_c0_g1_i2.p1 TRINITY_DN2352_c0_g1~~TRINITY_DN2352_c0_g1_i2.p1  ORF type:complete len:651 (+),score=30.07 TRINITY_DN2352_c0_g1_i2:33-1955(+)